MERHSFARGTWGGEFHPDFRPQPGEIVVAEHWAQSGFANTDLDFRLKQHGITHVVLRAASSPLAASSLSAMSSRNSARSSSPVRL